MNGNNFVLVRQGCGREARLVKLEKNNSVGRAYETSISLLSLYVSRQHCQIYYNAESNKWYVGDADSLNGTFINNKKITFNSVLEFNEGDYLGFGIDCYQYLQNYNDVQSDESYFVYQLMRLDSVIASEYEDSLCNGVGSMRVEE